VSAPPISGADRVQILCVLYISVWATSPPLAYGSTYRAIAILATGVWFGLELVDRRGTLFRITPAKLCALLYVAYSAAVTWLTEGADHLVGAFQIYIYILFLFFFESYNQGRLRQLRIVFWPIAALFIVWMCRTLMAFEVDRHVARFLVRSSAEAVEYSESGIGGYGLVYSSLVALPVCVYVLKRRFRSFFPGKGRFINLLAFGLLGLFGLLAIALVLKAGYSIAVLVMAGGLIILFTATKQKESALPLVIGALVFAGIIAVLIGPAVIDFLSTLSEGTMYERKLSDTLTYFRGEGAVGTFRGRFERYERSIDLFLDNPIVGTLKRTDLGKHSSVLDNFARYGILVGLMFLYTLVYLPLRVLRRSNSHYGLALSVTFVTVSFATLNNVFASFGYVLFIFYPVALSYIPEAPLERTRPPAWRLAHGVPPGAKRPSGHRGMARDPRDPPAPPRREG
jgi:hypothetical protein